MERKGKARLLKKIDQLETAGSEANTSRIQARQINVERWGSASAGRAGRSREMKAAAN
jgi:hypothetical protein